MGGGGGPGREIPEQVIQDALNNEEDFTLEENETTTFTEDLEIPQGRTLTVRGTLDLGDGNTLLENGKLIIDGGSIINEASDIILDGEATEIINGGSIAINGTLTVKNDIVVAKVPELGNPVVTAKKMILKGGVTLEVKDRDLTTKEIEWDLGNLEITADPNFFIPAGLVGVLIQVTEELKVSEGSTLSLDNDSKIRIGQGATAVIEGTIKLNQLEDPKYVDPETGEVILRGPGFGQINNNGDLFIYKGGSIIHPEVGVGPSQIIGDGTGTITVSGNNDNFVESNITNVQIYNNRITVGEPPFFFPGLPIFGKIYLGLTNEKGAITTPLGGGGQGQGAIDWYESYKSNNVKLTVRANRGIVYYKTTKITAPEIVGEYNYIEFPQGVGEKDPVPPPLEEVTFYPKNDNPGFLLDYYIPDSVTGCIFKQENLHDETTGEIIAVKTSE